MAAYGGGSPEQWAALVRVERARLALRLGLRLSELENDDLVL